MILASKNCQLTSISVKPRSKGAYRGERPKKGKKTGIGNRARRYDIIRRIHINGVLLCSFIMETTDAEK